MLVRDETLYLGTWHSIVALDSQGLDASGDALWRREVTGGVLSLLCIGSSLYAGTRDGWVYQTKLRRAHMGPGHDIVVREDDRSVVRLPIGRNTPRLSVAEIREIVHRIVR
jgi:hypothetical protein